MHGNLCLDAIHYEHMWWLILHVKLSSHGVPRLNLIFGCVFEDFQMKWAFESMDSVECLPQGGWASSKPLRAWIEQNTKEGIHPFLPDCLSWDIKCLLPLVFLVLRPSDPDQNLRHQLPWFSGFGLCLNYTTGFPRSPVYRQQIVGLLGLHTYVCQFLKINLFLYTGIPQFIALHFTALHRYWIFIKIKVRTSTNKWL